MKVFNGRRVDVRFHKLVIDFMLNTNEPLHSKMCVAGYANSADPSLNAYLNITCML